MFVLYSENFVRVFPDFFTEAPVFLRCLFNDSVAFLRGCGIKNRHTGPDDPGFLRCDLRKRVSEILHVVIADGSDHADKGRLYRTGSIQPAAQACLENCVFHACFPESTQCHSQKKFKEGRMGKSAFFHSPDCPECIFEKPGKRAVIDRCTVNGDSLIDLHQMRRSKKPRPFSFRTEHPVKIGTHGSFSVGSGHMDHFQIFLRIPQIFQKSFRVHRIILFCKFRNFQYISYCLVVCHSSCSSS